MPSVEPITTSEGEGHGRLSMSPRGRPCRHGDALFNWTDERGCLLILKPAFSKAPRRHAERLYAAPDRSCPPQGNAPLLGPKQDGVMLIDIVTVRRSSDTTAREAPVFSRGVSFSTSTSDVKSGTIMLSRSFPFPETSVVVQLVSTDRGNRDHYPDLARTIRDTTPHAHRRDASPKQS